MGKIDLRRMLLGGVVAGQVCYWIEWVVYGYVFPKDLEAAPGTKGLFGMNLMLWFLITDTLYGILLVFTYASIRPRFGPGPKAALVAAFIMWGFTQFLHGLSEATFAMAPGRFYILTTLIAVVELPLAALAGARLYKEA